MKNKQLREILEPYEKIEGAAEIVYTKAICKQQGYVGWPAPQYQPMISPVFHKQELQERYIGWPTVARTRSGELLAVFSGDRDFHVCPWGRVFLVRSSDQGETWSEPVCIANTPLDDRDAGIIETKEGTLVVAWFSVDAFIKTCPYYARHSTKSPPEVRERWLGQFVIRSTDGGKTWGPPAQTVGSAPHGPIELADGRLLYVGINCRLGDERTLAVEESRDDGLSWKHITDIPIPDDEPVTFFAEPHVVETTSGKLVAMFRYESNDTLELYLWQSESLDGGKSWSVVHPTPIWGYPPHLLELSNGWLLVSYSRRTRPWSERACISRDEGETWDVENEISYSNATEDAVSWDFGYPSSVELDDGSILTVYYQTHKRFERPCLMSTRWKIRNKQETPDAVL